jgi:PAS domain S-box-containing protein
MLGAIREQAMEMGAPDVYHCVEAQMAPVQILIVDDHEAIRRGIRSIVTSRREWVVCGEASDGVEAVQKVKNLRPNIVLMDISMPRMDGFVATRIVQKQAPESRVIVVTQGDVDAIRAAGVNADAYVSKTHLARDLTRTIDEVLQDSNARKRRPAPRDRSSESAAPHDGGLLAAIVDYSDDAIISKDLNGIVTSWNKTAEQLFGYRAHEIVGTSITRIIPPERQEEEAEIITRIRRGERVEHFETVRLRKDGSTVDVSVTISPVKDDEGIVIGASKIARDITERKQMVEALREREQQLRSLADKLESIVHTRTEELERRNTEVMEQAEQLRELTRRLQQGQDSERRRIARELHDSAGQLLAVLSLNLQQIRDHAKLDEPTAEALHDSEDLVRQLSNEIRTMSYLLHPPLLDESGLGGAVRWYAKGLSERGGFEIGLSISPTFGRLPGDMELTLFRIVQECLTNVHRHSGSKTARIYLARNAQAISLQIEDEGVGIAPEKLAGLRMQRSGVGITGMRERVGQFGGVMNIESSERGTKVSVSIPAPASDGAQGPHGG